MGIGDGHYRTAEQMWTPVEGANLDEKEVAYNSAISLYRARHEWVNAVIKRGHAFHTPFRHRYELAVAVCHIAIELTALWLRLEPQDVPLTIGPWSHGPPIVQNNDDANDSPPPLEWSTDEESSSEL